MTLALQQPAHVCVRDFLYHTLSSFAFETPPSLSTPPRIHIMHPWPLTSPLPHTTPRHHNALLLLSPHLQPLRSKHDAVTNQCYHRFDHYCGWIGYAVAEDNYRNFFFHLVIEVIGHIMFLHMCYKVSFMCLCACVY